MAILGPGSVAAGRVVAIVTLGAGGSHQVYGMTVTAGRAAMVHAGAAFTAIGGFRVGEVE